MPTQEHSNNRERTIPSIAIHKEPDSKSGSSPGSNWNAAHDDFPKQTTCVEFESPRRLDDKLWKEAVRPAHASSEKFWPPSVWKSIVTRRAVINELLRSFPDYDQSKAEDIAKQIFQDRSGACVEIFTILVLLEKVSLLVHILGCRHGVRDHDLPLEQRQGSYELCRANSDPVCCLAELRPVSIELFDRFQRRLAVPVFKMTKENALIHLNLDAKDLLPWCEEEEAVPIKAMSGGEGTVIRVKIHEKCHEFHDTLKAINVAGGIFAVKRLRQRTLTKFRKEVDALSRFNGKVHPHLVTLLATFTQEGYYHMIFPWAECDLDRYWEDINPDPAPQDAGLVRWLSRQCLGIMEAVSVIHNPSHLTADKRFGRHGDIKAENILWYKFRPEDPEDRGILVVSDLGLTAINSDKSRSMQPNTNLKMTPAYRPPECDIKGGMISRAFDIWTLGCLYLELVCWLLRGHQGKVEFDNARTTPFIFGTKTDVYFDIELRRTLPHAYVFKVKDVVSKTISELHDDPHCSEWVHDILEVIENDMLVVMSKSHKRKTSQELLSMIRKMDHDVQSDLRYSIGPAPQNRTPFWRPHVGTVAELNEVAKKHVDNNGVGTHESDERPLHQGETWSD